MVCSIAHAEYSLKFTRIELNVYANMPINKSQLYIINLNLIVHHHIINLNLLVHHNSTLFEMLIVFFIFFTFNSKSVNAI